MALPKEVMDIIERQAALNLNSADAAATLALREIRELDEFEEVQYTLLKNAVQEEVYKARHRTNVKIKNECKAYSQPARVIVGRSRSVQEVSESVYNYRIAGTTLGEVWGRDLEVILRGESSSAQGHLRNVKLIEKLRAVVPNDRRVKEAVNEHELRLLIKEVMSD